MPKNRSKHKYPQEVIIIPNPDKERHERWDDGRDPMNFPAPYRMLLCSIQPNLGKTTHVNNVILRADPIFERILLYHCGGDVQKEYSHIECEHLIKLPDPNDPMFQDPVKTLLIIEDMNFKFFSKAELHKLDRLYGFTSTHSPCLLSIIVCSQSFFDVPTSVRRMSNIVVLWKTRDKTAMQMIGRRVGLDKHDVETLVKKYLKKPRDQLWIDCTTDSPYPFRYNEFQMIHDFDDDFEEKKEDDAPKNISIEK